jgi:hypothetical protein
MSLPVKKIFAALRLCFFALKINRGACPYTVIPGFYFSEKFRRRAHVAWRLSAEGREFERRHLPAGILVIGETPAREETLEF